MPLYLELASVWAIVMPPAARTARIPLDPSEPVPDRITPMARSPTVSASDCRKRSTEGFGPPGSWLGSTSLKRPPEIITSLLGGQI